MTTTKKQRKRRHLSINVNVAVGADPESVVRIDFQRNFETDVLVAALSSKAGDIRFSEESLADIKKAIEFMTEPE